MPTRPGVYLPARGLPAGAWLGGRSVGAWGEARRPVTRVKSKAKTTAPLWPCDFAGNPVRSRATSRDPAWNLWAPGRAGGGGTSKAALRVVLGPEAWGGVPVRLGFGGEEPGCGGFSFTCNSEGIYARLLGNRRGWGEGQIPRGCGTVCVRQRETETETDSPPASRLLTPEGCRWGGAAGDIWALRAF